MKTAEHRRYDRFLYSMCGLAGLLYGIDVGLISAALPYIKATCGFTPAQISSVVAAVLLGGIPGTFIAGFVADRWGRIAAFRLTSLILLLAVPAICLSGGNFVVMFTGRLLQGAGCAIVGLATPLYLAECADASHRGRGTGMIQLVLTIGLVAAAVAGLLATKLFGLVDDPATTLAAKNAAWQSIFWFSAVPTVFLFLGTFRLKESPRWLFKRGRKDEARIALLANNGEEEADAVLADLERNAAAERAGLSAADAARGCKEPLLQRKYVLPFALAFLIMCFTQATGINSVLNYSVEIFRKSGLEGTGANWADTAIKLANFLMTIVAVSLVDKRGRKFLLALGTAGAFAGLAAVGGTFFAVEHGWMAAGSLAGWLVASGFVAFVAGFAVGPGVCVWLADSELMPLRIREKGMMIAGLGNTATSWIIAQSFLPWSHAFGESSVFLTLAVFTAMYFATVVFFLPETKGKSLEEIERHFARR